MVAQIMPFIACVALLDGIQGVLSGVARGCGWQELGAVVNLCAFYGVGVPISVILAFLFHFGGWRQECLEVEFTAFKRACEDLKAGYNPGITFIFAQKRHNTLFFPQGNDKLRNGSVLPGTVVDKDACHPHNYDFFLVGTAAGGSVASFYAFKAAIAMAKQRAMEDQCPQPAFRPP